MITQEAVLARLEDAGRRGDLCAAAVANIRDWLTEPRYAPYANDVIQHIEDNRWRELDDAFWTVIPFGTGGRRGKMYPIGCNAINDRTIGESAQGLAHYVRDHRPQGAELACAIAYDTRHQSDHFARLCAEIMAANGLDVYFLQGPRSTPELSFAVRLKRCACGIMVTASHNPPSDNAVKVYWSNGGQLLPPHDRGVIDCVMNVQEIERVPFDETVSTGRITVCQDEVDAAFINAVVAQAHAGPRDLRVVYSPLHGVGATAVCPVLEAAGFRDVEVFAPHAEPDGDFPNVPGHVSNPENPAVFDAIVRRAAEAGADLVLASDPDCDRIGCAAPTGSDASSWQTLSGNQIGALLTEYVLMRRQQAGTLSPEHYVVKTLVTTEIIRRIADAYGVRTYGNLLVGFKWIGGVIDDKGPDRFVFGTEESHGYLVGSYARDKDGAVAALLLAELAAQLKTEGQTLHEKLEALFWQHGPHAERTLSQALPGAAGMEQTQQIMERLRTEPPLSLGGMAVARVRDYLNQTVTPRGGSPQPLEGPQGDLVILDLAREGNYAAVRPSGTEAKIKFYLFAYDPPEQVGDLGQARRDQQQRLDAMEADLRLVIDAVCVGNA